MFYRKEKEIKRLNEELAQVKFELRACRNAVAIEDEARDKRAAQSKIDMDYLLQERADLNFRYQTLESLLKQLRVNVSLPARKK